jgi:hypothetical protein
MQFLRLNNVFLPLQSIAFKSEGDGDKQVFKICTADLQTDLGTIPIAPGKINDDTFRSILRTLVVHVPD